jgi:hypothetical protein
MKKLMKNIKKRVRKKWKKKIKKAKIVVGMYGKTGGYVPLSDRDLFNDMLAHGDEFIEENVLIFRYETWRTFLILRLLVADLRGTEILLSKEELAMLDGVCQFELPDPTDYEPNSDDD